MNTINPYAPPQAELESLPADCSCWRKGSELVLRQKHSRPPRCVKCSQEASQPVRIFRLSWRHPIYGLFNRHAQVGIPLCSQHARQFGKRRHLGLSAMVAAGVSLGAFFWAANHAMNGGPFFLISLVCAAAASLLGHFSTPLKAGRIDRELIHLRGCHQAFLARLPDFPLR